jgi:hypothetical protein
VRYIPLTYMSLTPYNFANGPLAKVKGHILVNAPEPLQYAYSSQLVYIFLSIVFLFLRVFIYLFRYSSMGTQRNALRRVHLKSVRAPEVPRTAPTGVCQLAPLSLYPRAVGTSGLTIHSYTRITCSRSAMLTYWLMA